MRIVRVREYSPIARLLYQVGLNTSDVVLNDSSMYLGIWEGESLIGLAGVELLGSWGLLRSVAVAQAHQGQDVGKVLVEAAEAHAIQTGIQQLYLLTNDANRYFERHGYREVARSEVPDVIKATSQFTSTCPASAIVMVKELESDQVSLAFDTWAN